MQAKEILFTKRLLNGYMSEYTDQPTDKIEVCVQGVTAIVVTNAFVLCASLRCWPFVCHVCSRMSRLELYLDVAE